MKYQLFYRILILVSLASQLANPALAIELSEMVVDSISAHPQVKEKIHIYRQVLADQEIAQSGWRPSVDLEASTGIYETDSPSTGNTSVDYDSSRLELSVTQNLFNGYDTTHQITQTRERARAALLDLYDTADNIALEAIQAYLNVLKQQRLLELAHENVKSHEETLSQIRERNRSGVGRRSQLQQTEGRVARAHASLVAQQNNLYDSLTLLHQILGRYVDPDSLSVPDLPLLPASDLDSLIDKALLNHPAMQVAQSNIKAAYADHSRSLRTRYPNLDLRFAYETGNDIGGIVGDTDELSLILNLTYNFYRGGADVMEQRQKISATYEQKEFAARVRRQVINTLRLAWIADESLNKQLAFLEEHTTKARETVDSYREEFLIGQRNLIDLLDAKSELNTSTNQHANAYFDALAARYRVYEALGLAFESLNLDVKLDENNLKVARIEANATDKFPLPEDEDADLEQDWTDHCDNSLSNSQVNPYGCIDMLPVEIEPDMLPVEKEPDMLPVEKEPPAHVNSAPTPGNDNFSVNSNSVLVVSIAKLLENDTDADNDPLIFVDVSKSKNGMLAFDTNGDLVYRPSEGYAGIDSFTYTVSDGKGETALATATVWIKINEPVELELSKTLLVNFQFDNSELTDISKIKLLRIIEKIKSTSDVQIMIRTYTDNLGSDSYNLALSQRRAEALELLLNKHGISSDSIFAEGMGEKNPLADNETPAGQAINRRGEFIFTIVPAKKAESEDTIMLPVKKEPGSSASAPANDHFEVDSHGSLVVSIAKLLGNKSGADSDPSTSIDTSKAENGITATNANGDLVYRPIEGYVGTDVITYTVSDSAGQTETATVLVKVSEPVEIDLSKTQLVSFKFSKSELTDISKTKLLRIIEKVKSTPGVQIMIRTYTDNLGSDSYNLALSQRRAKAMELLLSKHGVSSDSIFAEGMGEQNPLADNETPAGQSINRRGEFVFTITPATN